MRKILKVQFVDKDIYYSDWIVLSDVVIDAFGKQGDLLAVIAFNESFHESPGLSALIQFRRSIRFHTLWVALSRSSSGGVRPKCDVHPCK